MSIAEGAAEICDETQNCDPANEQLRLPEPPPRRILQIILTVVIVVVFLWIGLLKDESRRNSARKDREERERVRQEAINERTQEKLKELISKQPGELDEATRRLFGIKEKSKGSSQSSEPGQ